MYLKQCFLLLFVIVINVMVASAQSNSFINSKYGRISVMRFCRARLHISDSSGTPIYNAGLVRINEQTYNNIKQEQAKADIDKCTPCLREEYDAAYNRLRFRCISYTDCPVGKDIQYYPSGKIKTVGHWRENDEPTWKNFKCGMTGDWVYYNESGKITSVECHDNDKPY